MKSIVIGVLLFFLSSSVLAQPFHEIKFNTFGFVMDQISMSYEYVVKKSFGVEFGIGYNYEPQTLLLWNNTTPPSQITSVETFKKNYWVVMLHGKFYPFKRANGNRFHLGGYFHFQSPPEIESNYFVTYEEHYNKPTSYKPQANYIIGGLVGYKLMLLKQRILLEPVCGIGVSMSNSDFEIGGFGFEMTGFLQINLGCRF